MVCMSRAVILFLFFKDFIYLFLDTREEREKEGERNIDVREKHRSIASRMCPAQGPNLKSRHVPWTGIEPAAFLSVG